MSSVTATVPADREAELISGYREMNGTDYKPVGLLRSELLRGQNGRWLIQTLWRDREVIMAAREPGKPSAALALSIGSVHALSWVVVG